MFTSVGRIIKVLRKQPSPPRQGHECWNLTITCEGVTCQTDHALICAHEVPTWNASFKHKHYSSIRAAEFDRQNWLTASDIPRNKHTDKTSMSLHGPRMHTTNHTTHLRMSECTMLKYKCIPLVFQHSTALSMLVLVRCVPSWDLVSTYKGVVCLTRYSFTCNREIPSMRRTNAIWFKHLFMTRLPKESAATVVMPGLGDRLPRKARGGGLLGRRQQFFQAAGSNVPER
jgi:hypothetical protein